MAFCSKCDVIENEIFLKLKITSSENRIVYGEKVDSAVALLAGIQDTQLVEKSPDESTYRFSSFFFTSHYRWDSSASHPRLVITILLSSPRIAP